MMLRPTSGTRLYFLGDEGVLFCESRQELHRLNTSAARIWCHLQDGLDAAGIAAALAADTGLAPIEARRFVDTALADWRRRHLLGGGASDAPPPAPAVGEPPPRDVVFHATRHYALLDVVVALRFTAPAQAAQVDAALAHLCCDRSADTTIDIVDNAGITAMYRRGGRAAQCYDAEEVVPAALYLVCAAALEAAAPSLLQLHAGVVGGGAGCLLLPAPPGSGKSTLTAALVHTGYRYYSDEVAPVAPDLTVRPVPVPIGVKLPGLEPLRLLFPQLAELPVHRRGGDGKRIVYLPPPASRLAAGAAPACGIVFPRFIPGAATFRRRLSPGEALQRLLQQCSRVPLRLTPESASRLIGWIARVPAFELTYSQLASAVDDLRPLLNGDQPCDTGSLANPPSGCLVPGA